MFMVHFREGMFLLHEAVKCTNADQLELVRTLLKYGANLNTDCKNGNTALHLAVSSKRSEVAIELCMAGANPLQKNKEGKNPIALLPENSPLADEMRTASQSRKTLQALWNCVEKSSISSKEFLSLLKSEYIWSFSDFVLAHNLILLAYRNQVFSTSDLEGSEWDENNFLINIYLSVLRLELSLEQKLWFFAMAKYAEKLGIIPSRSARIEGLGLKVQSNLHSIGLHLYQEIAVVAREIVDSNSFIQNLNHTNKYLDESLQSLLEGKEGMLEDMKVVSVCLQELYVSFQAQERNQSIFSLLNFCFSLIPIVSDVLFEGMFSSNDDFWALQGGKETKVAENALQETIAVDIGSHLAIQELISTNLLKKLSPCIRAGLISVIENSSFDSIENLKSSVTINLDRLKKKNEVYVPSCNDSTLNILMRRFSGLASSDESIITAQDAIKEIVIIHQSKLEEQNANVLVDEDFVDEIVMKYMFEDSITIDFEGFKTSYHEVSKKYPTGTIQKEPPELRERFRNGAGKNKKLKIKLAKCLLRALFNYSSDSSTSASHELSFTRQTSEWNDRAVEDFFKSFSPDNIYVLEEEFVQVSMKVLFG